MTNNKKQNKGSGGGGERGALSIANRSVDLILVVWWITFLFTVTFTDLHNFLASYLGVPLTALKDMDLPYPPKVLTEIYFKWAETLDPLLLENPLWWQAMEWINICVLAPFSLIAIFGYLSGMNCLRNWSIIVSSFTFYSVALCIFCTVYGDHQGVDLPMFLGVYVPYMIFPALIVLRNWNEKPFSKPLGSIRAAFIGFVGTVTLAVFISYSAKWFFIHMPQYPKMALEPKMFQQVMRQLQKLP